MSERTYTHITKREVDLFGEPIPANTKVAFLGSLGMREGIEEPELHVAYDDKYIKWPSHLLTEFNMERYFKKL